MKGPPIIDRELKTRTEALRSAIDNVVNAPVRPGMVTAAEYAKHLDMTYSQVLDHIISGKFQLVARKEASGLFHSLMVFKEASQMPPLDFVTSRMAGRLLRVSPYAVAALIEAGILTPKTKRGPASSSVPLISVDEIQHLREKFVSMAELVALSGLGHIAVFAILTKCDVHSAHPEKALSKVFYHRDEILRVPEFRDLI